MNAKDYVESLALALSRLRGGGLLLSPADAQLALSWHAAGVPLSDALHVLRTGKQRLRGAATRTRGAQVPALTLQAFAAAVEDVAKRTRRSPLRLVGAAQGLSVQLREATRKARLPARLAWESLAERADGLLSAGTETYWSEAIAALRASLRELPRAAALRAGAALRKRLARRPSEMPRRRYQRSLQLQLLSAASETLDVPPSAFLL
jgi:hypothetical protein